MRPVVLAPANRLSFETSLWVRFGLALRAARVTGRDCGARVRSVFVQRLVCCSSGCVIRARALPVTKRRKSAPVEEYAGQVAMRCDLEPVAACRCARGLGSATLPNSSAYGFIFAVRCVQFLVAASQT